MVVWGKSYQMQNIFPKQVTIYHFMIPTHPGAYATIIVGNASNIAQAQAKAEHQEAIENHKIPTIVQRLLTNQIVTAINEAYIKKLHDNDIGFL